MSDLIQTGKEISKLLELEYLEENPHKDEIWVNGEILIVWLQKMKIMKNPNIEIDLLFEQIKKKQEQIYVAREV